MGKNIVLIGFMGTGKSSVGYKLAQKLKMQFIDMDREVEKITGMSVSDIFRIHGEKRFRSEEELLARKLGKSENTVIATGGGVVLDGKNIESLKKNGILIRLDATPEDIYERVNRKKGIRPLLKKDLKLNDIKIMLQEREGFYACANFRVDTSNKGLIEIIDEIIGYIRENGANS